MEKLIYYPVTFGCDPEFFFSKDGRIIGAEKVLPEEGLVYKSGDLLGNPEDGRHTSIGTDPSKIIIDGVQAELNPRPNICRANLGNEIACCFKKLAGFVKDKKGINIDFYQTIKLDKEDMDVLSDKSKKFGCMPSKNAHNGGKESRMSVDASVYQYRSAGGHIHLGSKLGDKIVKEVLAQPERIIKLMDVIVGNTCVLIDRDAGNIERRKVYGRAGEFRTPKHGVEYRTLSNFWLRSYQLMSLVMGLARVAVIIVANNRDDEFLKLVDMEDITEAINKNDFKLALSNFKKIEKLWCELMPNNTEQFEIAGDTMPLFKHFVKMGLDHWFKEAPLKHWTSMPEGHSNGFGNFLLDVVKKDKEAMIAKI